MDRRTLLSYLALSVAALCSLAASVWAFVLKNYALGGITATVFCCALLLFFAYMIPENFSKKCDLLISEKKWREAEALLEKRERSLLYPFCRMAVLSRLFVTYAALDELKKAEETIEKLRHDGGAGWKYRTAFVFILIQLDGGDLKKAREEFEDFRTHNENVALYKEQIEILEALFARLFSNSDEKLPQSAVDCPYPVLQRILGKHFEKRASESGEWLDHAEY